MFLNDKARKVKTSTMAGPGQSMHIQKMNDQKFAKQMAPSLYKHDKQQIYIFSCSQINKVILH